MFSRRRDSLPMEVVAPADSLPMQSTQPAGSEKGGLF